MPFRLHMRGVADVPERGRAGTYVHKFIFFFVYETGYFLDQFISSPICLIFQIQ